MGVSGGLKSYRDRLAAAQVAAVKARGNPARWPFREAAAVLSRFMPTKLRSLENTPGEIGWDDFLLDCEPASKESGEWWQLRDEVRRAAFRRLGNRQRMQKALEANPERSDDELQRALTAAISGESRGPLTALSREQLSAIVMVRDWLGSILDGLPTETDLRRALVVAEILSPLQRLAGGGRFAGRTKELDDLRGYIGVIETGSLAKRVWSFVRETYFDLTSRPPRLVTGPGGIGKSSLMARLILDYSEDFESPDALPFVYLDLDRAILDPLRPLSLIAEAALQLLVEWPLQEPQLRNIVDQVTITLQAEGSFFEGQRGISGREDVLAEFGKCLALGSNGRPILFVIDTFEEAQYLGFEVVMNLGRLLTNLQRAAPMLRIVLAGRADLRGQTSKLPTKEIKLGDLSRDEARELLRRNMRRTVSAEPALLDEVINLIGCNPLSLKLASSVLNDAGLEELKSVDVRNWLLLRVRAETVQARLYGRILAHIHDENVRRLVKPGLQVRRLTEAVIREVLAEPCGISMSDPSLATQLMVALGNEVALVYRDKDGSLRHTPDVRRLMFKDLESELPAATIRDIHNRAVSFYETQPPDPVLRAEEIYHRLMRGDDPSSLNSRWMDGMGVYLRTALEEVPPAAQVWLSKKLGITPDQALLALVDLEDWENITARSVQRLIGTGDAQSAIAVLRQRSERTNTSPLYLLESEAFRLLGRWTEAREVAERGIVSSARAGQPAVQRDLLVQLALIEETAGNIDAAFQRIESALAVPGDVFEPIDRLRVTTTEIRLLRKLGSSRDKDRHAAIDRAEALLTPGLLDNLNQQPGLLRETVAELGKVKPEVITQALEVLGLDSTVKEDKAVIARALAGWDDRLASEAGGTSELARRVDISGNVAPDRWHKFVLDTSGRKLSMHLVNWRAEMKPDRDVDHSIVDFYRSSVENALFARRTEFA
jgi:hypothetical protein